MGKEKDSIDWALIHGKIKEILTVSEENRLKEWMQQNPEGKKVLERARKYYEREDIPVVDLQRTDRAWAEIEKLCRRSLYKDSVRKLRFWSVAASILLMAGSAIMLYQWEGKAEQSVRLQGIEPGGPKACLILSDGTVINLGKNTAEQQFSEKQANIRLSQSELTYEVQENPVQETYNTLQIPLGGEYSLLLSDGTRVWLNAKSELVYPVAFCNSERKVRLRGEAYFEVAKDADRPFVVETGDVQVRVLGTSFNVNAYEDEAAVTTTLVTGRVLLLSDAGNIGELLPSQQAIWSKTEKKAEIRQVKPDIYIQWREGRFVFRDQPLEDIMRTLSRWYDMDYEFSSPELAQCRFYGVIGRYENISELLNQFEKTEKVHFSYEGKKVIVKK